MDYLISCDLINYVDEGQVKGRNVSDANHLMYQASTNCVGNNVDLVFICLLSSDLHGTSHEFNINNYCLKK